MNELMIFSSPEFGEIRTIEENGKVLFCGKDVAAALGYKDSTNAIKQHCKGVVKRHPPHPQNPEKTIEMNFIPEGDIYRLAAKSELPGAERFESWIFDEVLPSIRRTGGYIAGQENMTPAKTPQELAAADKRATAMLLNAKNRTAANLQKLYDRAGINPGYQALALSDFYAVDGVNLPRIALQGVKQTYDKGTIAKMVGIYSKASGGKKPHAQAIGAIIETLEISSDEREALPYCNHGHDGIDYQYTESVVEKVRAWVEDHGRPMPISIGGKNYTVIYRAAGKEGPDNVLSEGRQKETHD